MHPHLFVHFLPELVAPEQLAKSNVVVIDVLRATTSIIHAVQGGCKEVIPCLEVEEARQIAARYERGQAVLGGERNGVKIEGFDYGNSPSEYSPESVAGRTVVFTTTNGTKAMQRCKQAARVSLCGFVNLTAVARDLCDLDWVDIVCAGTGGEVTREDILCAGALVDRLIYWRTTTNVAPNAMWSFNDQCRMAVALWKDAMREGRFQIDKNAKGAIAKTLRDSLGGRNLEQIGQTDDITMAADVDRFMLVPDLYLDTWRIKPAPRK